MWTYANKNFWLNICICVNCLAFFSLYIPLTSFLSEMKTLLFFDSVIWNEDNFEKKKIFDTWTIETWAEMGSKILNYLTLRTLNRKGKIFYPKHLFVNILAWSSLNTSCMLLNSYTHNLVVFCCYIIHCIVLCVAMWRWTLLLLFCIENIVIERFCVKKSYSGLCIHFHDCLLSSLYFWTAFQTLNIVRSRSGIINVQLK